MNDDDISLNKKTNQEESKKKHGIVETYVDIKASDEGRKKGRKIKGRKDTLKERNIYPMCCPCFVCTFSKTFLI